MILKSRKVACLNSWLTAGPRTVTGRHGRSSQREHSRGEQEYARETRHASQSLITRARVENRRDLACVLAYEALFGLPFLLLLTSLVQVTGRKSCPATELGVVTLRSVKQTHRAAATDSAVAEMFSSWLQRRSYTFNGKRSRIRSTSWEGSTTHNPGDPVPTTTGI